MASGGRWLHPVFAAMVTSCWLLSSVLTIIPLTAQTAVWLRECPHFLSIAGGALGQRAEGSASLTFQLLRGRLG